MIPPVSGIDGPDPAGGDLGKLPKFELHVHLEGTVPPPLLRTLARRNGLGEAMGRGPLAARPVPRAGDLGGFLERFKAVCGLFRTPQDFHDAARHYAGALAGQNALYAEIHLSLQVFTRAGIDRRAMLEAIHTAFEAARRETGIRLGLILDGVRQWGPESMRQLVDLAAGSRRWGVVGLGMGGDERSFPPAAFREAFAAARRRGWKTTVHAGEAAGPEAVLQAIDILRVDRIEHGIRAAEDAGALDRLAARRVPLDLCPTSQRFTGAVDRGAVYPLREFLRRDIPVTIGSDDPALFATDLTRELQWVRRACRLSAAELVRLQENGLRAAFLSADDRRELERAFRRQCRSWFGAADRGIDNSVSGRVK